MDEFNLTISTEPGCVIYYTTDGSDPDENSIRYDSPIKIYDKSEEPNLYASLQHTERLWREYTPYTIPVNKAFIIKAIAVGKDGIPSEISTGTYFIGDRDWDNDTGLIISLTVNPEDFFGQDGIYMTGLEYDEWYGENDSEKGSDKDEPDANFERKGPEWEIAGNMTVFRNGQFVDDEPVGIRISGGASRFSHDRRLSVFARKRYGGTDRFHTDFFGGNHPVHSILFRPVAADIIIPVLTKDRSPISMDYEPVTVYINGEYWYTTYIREKFSAAYFYEHFGIERENLYVVKGGLTDIGQAADEQLYLDIYDYIDNHDLSIPEYYESFGEIIDIQNYIDYQCINVYAENTDYDEAKNTYMWRSKQHVNDGSEDGRWRWALYDLDSMTWNYSKAEDYGVDEDYEINVFTTDSDTAGAPLNQRTIFHALKQNDAFCRQFVLSFMDIINTDFEKTNVENVLRDLGSDLEWNGSFFLNREKYVTEHLSEEFGLTGDPATVEIGVNNPNGGTIKINTIEPDLSNGNWTGKYFTDYALDLTALPNKGYRFVGWFGDISSESESIQADVEPAGTFIIAEFERFENE